jgi:hypothetical protein
MRSHRGDRIELSSAWSGEGDVTKGKTVNSCARNRRILCKSVAQPMKVIIIGIMVLL